MTSEAADVLNRSEVSRKVLQILHRYQRTEAAPDSSGPCVGCFTARQSKIDKFVARNDQIHFVIPAFPAKSPNPQKVLGELPDLGEHVALEFLQSICDYVGHFYSPGARITICSDGHVFGDVVGVSDESVTRYRESLANTLEAEKRTSLALFGLDDAFDSRNYPGLRSMLDRDYAVPIEELRTKVRTDLATRSLFNGIQRFMFEDAVHTNPAGTSRTQLRNASKHSAYRTILRSNAWSRVVADRFPDAIRLSIHPQEPHSEKFGIHLMRTGSPWLTPWHGVVLDDGTNLTLVRRWEAEKVHATAVWRDGRPSHFVAPHLGFTPQEGLRA